jgi:hypothetical protein
VEGFDEVNFGAADIYGMGKKLRSADPKDE